MKNVCSVANWKEINPNRLPQIDNLRYKIEIVMSNWNFMKIPLEKLDVGFCNDFLKTDKLRAGNTHLVELERSFSEIPT